MPLMWYFFALELLLSSGYRYTWTDFNLKATIADHVDFFNLFIVLFHSIKRKNFDLNITDFSMQSKDSFTTKPPETQIWLDRFIVLTTWVREMLKLEIVLVLLFENFTPNSEDSGPRLLATFV